MLKMNRNLFILLISAISFLSSCKPQEKTSKLNYMQSVEELATQAAANNAQSTIQIADQLIIFVSAKNMEVVRPFNQNYYNNQTPGSVSTANSEKTYLVDSEGNISFPVIGKINTVGKSLEQLRNEITTEVSVYVKEPTVALRLANFKVTVLGEVNRPGQYTIPEGQTTLLNALGLAGDLTIYGERENILMVRNTNGSLSKERLNLMDADFINSPFFQLKQGDVIYVSANETKEKLSRQDPNTGIYIAVAGTIIGLAGIFITIFKN
ncbi:Polysaccharide export outer membrane protein [Flavobacteriaceae bacterium 3519-10]|nr:Polysaccharide export outer membrane protein [Flavobacteriaceae bacterium 3519-10]